MPCCVNRLPRVPLDNLLRRVPNVCVWSMNACPEVFYYSSGPDASVIGGWRRREEEEERQRNNEVCCSRVATFCCCCTRSAAQFATLLWVFFCFCNSTAPLISLPDLSVFRLFCFPAYSLHPRLPPPLHSYWCEGRCFGPPEGEYLWYKKA